MHFEESMEFAVSQDHYDPLSKFRNEFHFPSPGGKPAIYFTGNSLGLQPKKAEEYLLQELEDWKNLGVEGHFHAKNPWFSYHEPFGPLLSGILGAAPGEAVAMGSLTNNLHLLMVSFYRPTKTRYKIICEAKAFPSDQYALDSQVRFHGFDPSDAVIEVAPREGETTLRTEDILDVIARNKSSVALVMFGAVNYFTGQYFNVKEITKAAHAAGAMAGFDLAHAAGNIKMALHDWDVDFAAWCSYKYLNSGPGSVGGIFVHQKHHASSLPRFHGWWGTNADTRFLMAREMDPFRSAEAWQLSNAPVFSMAAHRASLEIFNDAGMDALVQKSRKLTGYARFLLNGINKRLQQEALSILTPEPEDESGCQLSVVVHARGKEVFKMLTDKGVIADWREPNVIRIAPVPLYNSFMDVYTLGQILEDSLKKG